MTLKIRAYTPDDFATVEQWAKARGMVLIPQLLGKNGFLIEDDKGPILTAFVYLIFDCPIVQIDHLMGRPGSSITSMRAAWDVMQSAICRWVDGVNKSGGYDYRLFRCFTSEEIAHEAVKKGWLMDGGELKCIRYAL